jgi:hypothetical protein
MSFVEPSVTALFSVEQPEVARLLRAGRSTADVLRACWPPATPTRGSLIAALATVTIRGEHARVCAGRAGRPVLAGYAPHGQARDDCHHGCLGVDRHHTWIRNAGTPAGFSPELGPGGDLPSRLVRVTSAIGAADETLAADGCGIW